jgi:Spy/CpxP family protein refolding chaperone
MKKWHVGLMVVLFVALTTSVFAFAPRGGGPGQGQGFGQGPCAAGSGGPGCAGMGRGGFGAALNLSKEQMDKMWQLRETFRNDTQPLRHELFQKKFDLRKLYTDPNTDEATLLAKQKEVNALRQQMQDKMVQFKLEQRKVFTPEQLKKLGEGTFGPGFAGRGFGQRGKGFGRGGPCKG